jgi:hypothetical protein
MLKQVLFLSVCFLVGGCELSQYDEVKNTALYQKENKKNSVADDDLIARSPISPPVNEFDLCLYEKKLDHTLDVGEDAVVEPSLIAAWKSDCEKT